MGSLVRRRRVVIVLALAAALAVVGCSHPASCPVALGRPAGPPFLWRVTAPGGSTGWLFGTVHNAGAAEVPAAVWTALDAAPVLLTELGDVEPDPEVVRELARIGRGPGLDTSLPSDDWFELSLYLDGIIKPDDLRRARPWYAMSLVSGRAAPSPSPTIDAALVDRAQARHRPVRALEAWRDQLTALADGVTVDDLRDALHARATMRCDAGAIRDAYAAGAEAELMVRLNVAGSRRLLVERNRAWMPAIEAALTDGGAVVAVGVSHLLGDDSVVALLTARGYQVERWR